MGTSGDKVAIRLTQMIRAFNDGKRLTLDEMADEFQVHPRTVQRDLSRFAFLPIEQEEGRYFLAEYALGKLSYKDVKHFSTISGIGKLYPKLSDEKISEILNPMVRYWVPHIRILEPMELQEKLENSLTSYLSN